jgi:hypothetical protein
MQNLNYALQIKHIYTKEIDQHIVVIGILGGRGVDYHTMISTLSVYFCDNANENLWKYLVDDEKTVCKSVLEQYRNYFYIRTVDIMLNKSAEEKLSECFWSFNAWSSNKYIFDFVDSKLEEFTNLTGLHFDVLHQISDKTLGIFDELQILHEGESKLNERLVEYRTHQRKTFLEDAVTLYDIFKVYPYLKDFCCNVLGGSLDKEYIKTQLGKDSFYYNVNPIVFSHDICFVEKTKYGFKRNNIRQKEGCAVAIPFKAILQEQPDENVANFDECGYIIELNTQKPIKALFNEDAALKIAYRAETVAFNWNMLYFTLTNQKDWVWNEEQLTTFYTNKVLAKPCVQYCIKEKLQEQFYVDYPNIVPAEITTLTVESWQVKLPKNILTRFREDGVFYGKLPTEFVDRARRMVCKHALMAFEYIIKDIVVELDDDWNVVDLQMLIQDKVQIS